MAKQGMKRFYPERKKNEQEPVPELSGKAKSGKKKARPLMAGTGAPAGQVYHGVPHEEEIPAVFPALDNDLAVQNIENDFDMTAADLQDLEGWKG